MGPQVTRRESLSLQPIHPSQPRYAAALPGETPGGEAAKQLCTVFFKWKYCILCFVLAFTLAAGLAMYLKPPVRSAAATILLKPDRMTLQISGLGPMGGKLPYSPQVIQSEVELMKSRAVLLPVAEALLTSSVGSEQDLSPGDVEAMIAVLRKNTVPVALPDSSVLQVTYFAESSEEAVKVLSMILDQYMLQHEVVHTGSTKLLTFYEQEAARVGAQLHGAEERLKEWQEANQVVSIDEQINRLIVTLAERQGTFQHVQAELAASRHHTKDPVVARLKSDLITAEMGLQEILQRYTNDDRRVQERREQVALLKQELQTAERTSLTSLTSQRDTLRRQVQEATIDLAAMREKKVEFNRLARLVELSREAYMLYGKKVEEARIAARLDKEQLANVAVIEAPYATRRIDRNKRIGVTLLAAVVGLSLGVAIAFGCEFFNNSLRTEEDVEYHLGVPVLASIPDFKDRPLALDV